MTWLDSTLGNGNKSDLQRPEVVHLGDRDRSIGSSKLALTRLGNIVNSRPSWATEEEEPSSQKERTGAGMEGGWGEAGLELSSVWVVFS